MKLPTKANWNPARLLKLVCVACVLVAAGCATSQPSLPSITEETTNTHYPGKIIWHDLITSTPEASKQFYGLLFGWEFVDLGVDLGLGRTVNYTLIRNRGRLIGGMVDANRLGRPDPKKLSQWVVVMSVADVTAAVAEVRKAGGKILTPPTDVEARGEIALVEDNQGATLALLHTRDGDPHNQAVADGDFLWDEVWPDDVASATAFYAGLTGLTAGTRELSNGREYHYMGSADAPRFGVLHRPIDWLPPTWVSYLRVGNVASIVARVPQLGGTVLVPEQDRAGQRVAMIAGPSGAGIAIQTWSGPGVGESD
jgi:hypothetical protein